MNRTLATPDRLRGYVKNVLLFQSKLNGAWNVKQLFNIRIRDLGMCVCFSVAVLLPTQGTVQHLGTVPPVLTGLCAALQGLFQGDHPLLHLCLAVCGQEVAVAVLHFQLEAVAAHLRALGGELDSFDFFFSI